MAKAMEDATIVSNNFETALAMIDEKAKILGATFDPVAAKLSYVTQQINALLDAGQAVPQSLQDMYNGLQQLTTIGKSVETVFNGMVNGIQQMIEGVLQGTQTFGAAIRNFLRNILLSIGNEAFKVAMEPLKNMFTNFFRGLLNSSATQAASGGAASWAQTLGQSMKESLEKMFSNLWDWLGSMTSQLMNWLSSMLGGSGGGGGSIFGSIASSVGGWIGSFFQEGGIVTRPTLAVIGEQAPMRKEAVIPLDRIGQFGGGRPIYLTLVNDYSNAIDPRGMKTSQREVREYVLNDLSHERTVRLAVREASRK